MNTIAIDDLLGDKLTAFAPNTIGVRYTAKDQYGRPKCTEIIKQLYDCAFLSSRCHDLNQVLRVYTEISDYQIRHSNQFGLTIDKCLFDTIRTCELILSNGSGGKETYRHLIDGLRRFNNYKIGEPITVYDLQRFALSVGIIASKLIRIIDPSIRNDNKIDYFARTGINEKQLRLFADEHQLKDFYSYCLISPK